MRTAEALIVTPRSRSRSMLSSTCSCMSRSEMVPVTCNNRSASVLLPWSICAMMQKLRIFEESICAHVTIYCSIRLVNKTWETVYASHRQQEVYRTWQAEGRAFWRRHAIPVYNESD